MGDWTRIRKRIYRTGNHPTRNSGPVPISSPLQPLELIHIRPNAIIWGEAPNSLRDYCERDRYLFEFGSSLQII